MERQQNNIDIALEQIDFLLSIKTVAQPGETVACLKITGTETSYQMKTNKLIFFFMLIN